MLQNKPMISRSGAQDGVWCFAGSCITVASVKRLVRLGYSHAEIILSYPALTHDQIDFALNFTERKCEA